MVRGFLVPVLFAVALLVAAAPSQATSCGLAPGTSYREAVRATFADSDVVFEGVALDGPTGARALLSPARFRVVRYLKGSGSNAVEVKTDTERQGRLIGQVAGGFNPAPGEAWRIYAQGSPGDVLKVGSSTCGPTERLTGRRAERTREAVARSPDGRTPSPPPSSGSSLLALGVPAGLALLLVGGGFGAWKLRSRTRSGEGE